MLFIAFLLCITTSFSQTNYSQETLEKIKEVENTITGNVILNDAPPSTIIERMAKYKVKGVSIAVIHDYKIAWAKGYGWADEAEKRPVTTETSVSYTHLDVYKRQFVRYSVKQTV